MKKLMVDNVGDLRCGMALICPESVPDMAFHISAATEFYIDSENFWGVKCEVCGEWHRLQYVYRAVN